ncbi:hypothetical protein AMST5_03443 [freshwater sediment metagenome]|jgi:hypothetical protein|uniref:Uncharacterized protein n=1 Tax=freshwater sediment metagenome TaxID=556182 RepID=A0AA48REK4_9ZZZZ
MDIYICYNAISYSIAHALARRGVSLIIYDDLRLVKKPTRHALQIGLGERAFRFLRRLVAFRAVGTVYLPHHIHAPAIQEAAAVARAVHYLDDGLDTLRNRPRNFNLENYSPDSTLYTFFEYQKLGDWLTGRDVRRVASFRDYPDFELLRSKIINVRGATVVIESAGLSHVDLGRLGPDAIIFGHPNPQKNHPERAQRVLTEKFNVERSLCAEPARRVFVGESIALFYLLHFSPFPQTEIFVYLDDPGNFTSVAPLIDSRPNVTLMDEAFMNNKSLSLSPARA